MTFDISSKRGVLAAKGFRAATASVGIKKAGRKDMALVVSDRPAKTAGLFTVNQFAAAPVALSKQHLKASATHRAILFNSGSANACTGAAGFKDARELCAGAAKALGCKTSQVLIASTGVIGTRLPVAKMLDAVPGMADSLTDETGLEAARAIMTTDTMPKQFETSFTLNRVLVHVGGMAKGSGMIHPNMATLLAAVTTDVELGRPELAASLKLAGRGTFNAISVDGETSTNDTLFLMANGAAGPKTRLATPANRKLFQEALTEVLDALARSIVRDGEGASKFIEIVVLGARNEAEAMIAARAVGDSQLVKTAVAGEDANWGRVLTAIAATRVRVNTEKVKVDFNQVAMVRNGVDAGTPWAQANKALAGKDVRIAVDLAAGKASARYRTCDLTAKYVEINAGYRS